MSEWLTKWLSIFMDVLILIDLPIQTCIFVVLYKCKDAEFGHVFKRCFMSIIFCNIFGYITKLLIREPASLGIAEEFYKTNAQMFGALSMISSTAFSIHSTIWNAILSLSRFWASVLPLSFGKIWRKEFIKLMTILAFGWSFLISLPFIYPIKMRYYFKGNNSISYAMLPPGTDLDILYRFYNYYSSIFQSFVNVFTFVLYVLMSLYLCLSRTHSETQKKEELAKRITVMAFLLSLPKLITCYAHIYNNLAAFAPQLNIIEMDVMLYQFIIQLGSNLYSLNTTILTVIFFPRVIDQLAGEMGVDIEIVQSMNVVGSIDWGTLVNGTWQGVLGLLANGSADTACLMYQMTDLRDAYFDFSYPLTNVQPIYVVRRRVEGISSVLWNAFKPYSWVTWLVILASFLSTALVLTLISKVEVLMGKRKHFSPFEMLWHCVQLQLDERSEDMRFFSLSGNILLFIFSLLQAGMLIYLYEGLLLSALLQEGDANPFKDADEMIRLIAKREYHLTTNYMGNWYFDELRNSNSSHFVSLRSATQLNPVVQADTVAHALDLVEQGKYIFPIQEDSLAMQMSKERCNLVYVSEGLPQKSAHLVMNNNSVFAKSLNRAIIMQEQFIQRTFKKYFLEGFKIAEIPKCETEEFEQTAASKPLDLASVIGIFTLGGIGLASSVVAFILEIYLFLHNRVIDRRRHAKRQMMRTLYDLARVQFTSIGRNDNINLVKLIDVWRRKHQTLENEETERF